MQDQYTRNAAFTHRLLGTPENDWAETRGEFPYVVTEPSFEKDDPTSWVDEYRRMKGLPSIQAVRDRLIGYEDAFNAKDWARKAHVAKASKLVKRAVKEGLFELSEYPDPENPGKAVRVPTRGEELDAKRLAFKKELTELLSGYMPEFVLGQPPRKPRQSDVDWAKAYLEPVSARYDEAVEKAANVGYELPEADEWEALGKDEKIKLLVGYRMQKQRYESAQKKVDKLADF